MREKVEKRSGEGLKSSEDKIVVGYATTFDDPYVLFRDGDNEYKEVIASGALDDVDLSNIIFLYDHTGKVLARTSNGTLKVTIDKKGIYIQADLSKSIQARELYEEIGNELVTKMSWSFTVEVDEYDSSTFTRTIKKIGEMFDVSAVSLPANENTTINKRSFIKQSNLKRRLQLRLQIEKEI